MDRETFYSSIERLITESRNTFCLSPKRMVSDYNEENRITGDYNGRQILELLQNADDADSKEVEITFDKEQQQLVISNKGEPFSVGGIDSLMTANLSTKTRRQFIGNKGLGFRSILNWAHSVRIRTNGCVVEFSAAIAAEEFKNLPIDKTVKETLLQERGLSLTTIPFPVLAIPRVEYDISPSETWTTVIEISYKPEFEQKISDQLKDCREEILIFLNNIDLLRLKMTGEEAMVYKKTTLQEADLSYVEINGKLWRTETMEDALPPHLQDQSKIEKEYYNVTIAFQDDLSDEYYKLFNYFPTRLSVSLPCVIHATFDLNSSRDYLHESPKNEFMFQQLVRLLHQTAIKLARETEGNSDWRPFKLLLPLNTKTDSVLIGAFYRQLQQLHEELAVFPEVTGTYYQLKDVKYYGRPFSEWVVRHNYQLEFAQLLQPQEDGQESAFEISLKTYTQSVFAERVDSVSKKIIGVQNRAKLISFLLGEPFESHKGNKYSLLLNEEGEVIDKSNIAFTPIIESAGTFYRPEFIKIDFINRDLYDLLNNQQREKYQAGEPESREFQRLFKDVLNVQPYDSNNVLTRIITGVRDRIKTIEKEIAMDDLKVTVQALFENFKSLRYKEEVFTETCQLINQNGEIKDSSELFLSKDFKSGGFNHRLYEGVLNGESYISAAKVYGIIDKDQDVVESFFIWLGVNKHVQLVKVEFIKQQHETDDYLRYVFSKVKRPSPVTRFYFSGKGLGLIDETISKLSNERLLALIFKEDKLFQALEMHNSDKLTYQYSNNYPEISEKPSYITYQLWSLKKFSRLVIDVTNLPFLNIPSVNYDDAILSETNKTPSEINELLVKLGAYRSLSDFPTSEVYQFIQKCATNNVPTKQARKVYIQAFDHFRNLQMDLNGTPVSDLYLLATRNGLKEYKRSSEIYYSDNSVLPAKITDSLWMFDFPKRLGENQVSRYFKVNTLKNLKINVDSATIRKHEEDRLFQEWFSEISPFILAHRISFLKTKEDKREAAKALKNCSIQLVFQVEYSSERGSPEKLGYEEFLVVEGKFIICAEPQKTLDQLRTSPLICSAFAEIMCIQFKVNEAKNNYISVFKDNIKFSENLIVEDSLEDFLLEAKELLGLSSDETRFWETICKIKGIQWNFHLKDRSELNQFLRIYLNYQLSPGYDNVDFHQFGNSSSVNFLKSLCEQLQITLKDIKAAKADFKGLFNWHLNQLESAVIDIERRYANTVWLSLSTQESMVQETFLEKRNAFMGWYRQKDWNVEIDPMEFEIRCSSLLEQKANEHFQIILSGNTGLIQVCAEYKTILSRYEDIEKSFSSAQKSLLFFPGNFQKVSVFIQNINEDIVKAKPESVSSVSILPLTSTTLTGRAIDNSNSGKNSKGRNGAVNPSDDKRKRKAGLKAEQQVRDTLIKEFGRKNVQWVSGNSDEDKCDDSLGYDFLYRFDEESQWWYLEVKSISGNSFIISQNEMTVAFENKHKYHLALVTKERISLDISFFTNSELEKDFKTFNSAKSIKPLDYEIFVDIPAALAEQVLTVEESAVVTL